MYTWPQVMLIRCLVGCCLFNPGWVKPEASLAGPVADKADKQDTEPAFRINMLEENLRVRMEEVRSFDEDMALRPQSQQDTQPTSSDLRWIREHATAGGAQAQNLLGELYAIGEQVPQDSDEAREWFEKASAQNYAKAQYNLGIQYTDDTDGYVTRQDYRKAQELWEQAAGQGYARAESALGWLYSGPRAGMPAEYPKARHWYEKAAAQGDAYAQMRLGLMYEHGRGVAQDFAQARAWYEKAAAQGDARAMMSLGLQESFGLLAPPDLVKARQWFEAAAAQSDPMAQTFLADLYAKDSVIVPADLVRAYMWYSLAADRTAKDKYRAKDHRDLISQKMTPAQIAEAQQRTQQCQAQQFKGC